jgi:cytochrome c-type biogenesis protein CcmF
MIPEIGHFALWLALGVALMLSVIPMMGAARGRADWMAIARPAAALQFVLVAFAFGCLVAAFVGNDFSVLYVASNSNTSLPTQYRVAAVWGGHEGSMLLWLLMLTGWAFAVARFSRHLPAPVLARILSVMGVLSVGFLLFLLLTSNPFDRLPNPPVDGRDLNPLLQDPGMVFHPPMLYMGYVGLSVAFSFAVAALIGGNLDTTWARWTRPWTTVAWIFLTVGIALGSGWAYYELGWGGWWFWDPVENASFMPWLVGTALIHSLAVTEKRGSFKNWTVLLAICAFSLSLLGTFLVRSGVLTSVHAFATDPKRGIFILLFLSAVIGGSLSLFAYRAPKVGLGGAFALFSRETLLLVNNVLLMVAAGSVLLGTLYPLIIDGLGLGKLSVGPPYFNSVFVPIMVPLLFLIAVGPVANWKHADVRDLSQRLWMAAGIAVVLGALLPLFVGTWSPLVALGLLLAVWIVASSVFQIRARLKSGRPPRAYWGMHLAHIGIATFVVGVTMVKGYEVEKDVRMEVGQTVELGGYSVKLLGVNEVRGPNYIAQRGDVELSRDGQVLRTLNPEKRAYLSSQMPMTETAIDSGLTRDLYVSLGEPLEATPDGKAAAWSVRVYYKPFVVWIWLGCLLMAAGGGLAASDKRYRLKLKQRVSAPLQGATGAAA